MTREEEIAASMQLHELISGALDFEDMKPLKGKLDSISIVDGAIVAQSENPMDGETHFLGPECSSSIVKCARAGFTMHQQHSG